MFKISVDNFAFFFFLHQILTGMTKTLKIWIACMK
jgi:hypothetical protein